MNPAEKIFHLDEALMETGQTVVIQRPQGQSTPNAFSATATCRAQVISLPGFGKKEIILSPTDLANDPNWPEAGVPRVGDTLMPRKTDKAYFNGFQYTIQNVHPRYSDNVLIRVEIEAAG